MYIMVYMYTKQTYMYIMVYIPINRGKIMDSPMKNDIIIIVDMHLLKI